MFVENGTECGFNNKLTVIVPISGNRERLGTLVLSRFDGMFTDEDLVLAEYSATIIGLEILRAEHNEKKDEAKRNAVVRLAIASLSYSELEAMKHILGALNEKEGIVIASSIADKAGISRSVIVNVLKKFKSARVIEFRSFGMKGTHIKILNDKLMNELRSLN